ncbi:hypothetical protein PSQ19_10590 [Devosia algicola]|uniref:Uncharacterized protein n=1 Tax=Devosia algicola TaxID=3026418 RepID=A0ABY7YJC3_9HYPH|nr:hypothetical protein [Devosia algicola]WDR01294.1 hypothetical protein PSQ19_10590 [Devosia algicola]
MNNFVMAGFAAALCLVGVGAARADDVSVATDTLALEKLENVAEYLQDRLSDEVYDIDGVARAVGADPQDVVQYVRHNIAYRPYWGALKGGAGSLLDRTGNALDQSLLTARLMKLHGSEVRIGYAKLGDTAAAKVLALSRTEVPAPLDTIDLDAELLAAFLNEGGLTRGDIQDSVSGLEGAVEARTAELATKLPNFVRGVENGLSPVADFLVPPRRDAAAVRIAAAYFWTEYRDPQGKWQVLEPLPMNLAPDLRAEAEYFDIDEIPVVWVHEVAVAVSLRMNDGSQKMLASAVVPSTLGLYAPLGMMHRPILATEPASVSEGSWDCA